MKRRTLWSALTLLAAVLATAPLCGRGAEKDYTFDLVDWDKETTHLREPGGTVRFRLYSAEVRNEEALDQLYREQILPVLRQERETLHQSLRRIDSQLDNDQLDEAAVKALENEAQDAYHDSVDRIMKFVRKWNQTDENPYHKAKAFSLGGFASWQNPYRRQPVEKTWSSSSSHTETRAVETPQGTALRTTTTTKSSSVSVGVDPAGAIMGLTGLFGKKRKAPVEPSYLARVREIVSLADALSDLDDKDNKVYASFVEELKNYLGAEGGDREKSKKRLLSLLKTAATMNQAVLEKAAAFAPLPERALAAGAENDRKIAELLRAMVPLTGPLTETVRSVGTGIGAVRQALDTQAELRPPTEALLKAIADRERQTGELQDLGYRISENFDY